MKTHLKILACGVALLLIAGCAQNPVEIVDAGEESAPQSLAKAPKAVVAGAYIVMFKADVANPSETAQGFGRAHGFKVGHVYSHALKGFSARLPAQAVAALQKNPNVSAIEPDLIMQAFAQVLPTGVDASMPNRHQARPMHRTWTLLLSIPESTAITKI
jgi:hypothetical protein